MGFQIKFIASVLLFRNFFANNIQKMLVIFILVLELPIVEYILIIHCGDHQVVIHLWSLETTKSASVHNIVQDKLAMINNVVKNQ